MGELLGIRDSIREHLHLWFMVLFAKLHEYHRPGQNGHNRMVGFVYRSVPGLVLLEIA